MVRTILNLDCEEFVEIQSWGKSYIRDILEELEAHSVEEVYKTVKDDDSYSRKINSGNIPQISSFENGTLNLLNNLNNLGDSGVGYERLGYFLLRNDGKERKKTAYYKYGENHFKLGYQLGIVKLGKESKSTIYLSPLGKEILKIEDDIRQEIIRKLCLRIPIVQKCIKKQIESRDEIQLELQEVLAKSTAKRRTSSVKSILTKIEGDQNEF